MEGQEESSEDILFVNDGNQSTLCISCSNTSLILKMCLHASRSPIIGQGP